MFWSIRRLRHWSRRAPILISPRIWQRSRSLCADVENLATVADGTVDRIVCNELWNELATKLLAKKGAEYEEEHLRPNLNERKAAAIADWSGFVRAFEAKDIDALKAVPALSGRSDLGARIPQGGMERHPYPKDHH